MISRNTVIRYFFITAAVLFSACVLWILYLVDTGAHTKSVFRAVFTVSDRLTGGDKLGHFLLYGPFTLTVNAALNFRRVRSGLYLGSLLVFCFTLAEELGQSFIPSRNVELLDIFANSAGILLFTWLSLRMERLLFPQTELSAAPASRL